MHNIARKMRARRQYREFNRAVVNASPSMQQELFAAATRSGYRGQ
ncbi:MAG: hypothetical protein ABI345_14035 [Jatrophihabitans sp.]